MCLGMLCGITLLGEPLLAEDDPGWKAGAASVLITPQTSHWMAGYGFRDRPSDGKETELYAKALALEDTHGKRLVIVTFDLSTVPRALRDSLQKCSAETYQLPPEGLLLIASHTHSGPEQSERRMAEAADSRRAKLAAEYSQQLEEKLHMLIGQSLAKLEPARLGYAHARAGCARCSSATPATTPPSRSTNGTPTTRAMRKSMCRPRIPAWWHSS